MLRQRRCPGRSQRKVVQSISCLVEGVYSVGLCVSRFLSEQIYSMWTSNVRIKTRRQILQRHLAPCVVITSLETDAFMAIVACIDMLMVSRNPARGWRKRVLKEQLRFLKEKNVQGCVSRNSDPKKSTLRKAGQTRLNASAAHALKFSGRTWYEIQILDKKRPSRGVIQKGERHERNPCAPNFEERTPEETSRQGVCARKAAWDVARTIYKRKAEEKTTFYSPVEMKALVLSDEMDTLRRSTTPTTVVTANGEVQTNEEAQVYVHDLDLFVTVQLLEDTPAVPSLGKLTLRRARTFLWVGQRSKTTIDQSREENDMQNGQFRTSGSSRVHRHRRSRQVHLQVQ